MRNDTVTASRSDGSSSTNNSGGAPVGVVGALLSALAWGPADIITNRARLSITVDVWNLQTRFGVHVIVVMLIAAVLDALRAARESDARSRAFLATAAHQLRTPIAALGASVDALVMEQGVRRHAAAAARRTRRPLRPGARRLPEGQPGLSSANG